jgi:putative DNA primase/helicase
LGKLLAIVPDAHVPQQGKAAIKDKLLGISGEDLQTVNPKYREPIDTVLKTRFVILGNEVPNLEDSSGALANRYLPIHTPKSFLGQEDKELTARLLAELPAILNWAIEGWRRVRERGHFVMPPASLGLFEEIRDISSPVGQFVSECCEVREAGMVSRSDVYDAYLSWCQREGRGRPETKNTFGGKLAAAVPSLGSSRPGGVRYYTGISLRIRSYRANDVA